MSETSSSAAATTEGIGERLRSFAIGLLFALVLIIPRLLRLRHSPRTWLAFRILLAAAGAALVILPLSLGNNLFPAIAGLVIFLTSILLPSAKPDTSVSDKAKELGALVVISGGEYQPAGASAVAARLFVGADMIWVLNARLRAILAIPTDEISSAVAAESRGEWVLRVRWLERTADFRYRGVFAEHFARVAESTIRSVLRPALPVLAQKRAAGA
jgi:hypothetical protein